MVVLLVIGYTSREETGALIKELLENWSTDFLSIYHFSRVPHLKPCDSNNVTFKKLKTINIYIISGYPGQCWREPCGWLLLTCTARSTTASRRLPSSPAPHRSNDDIQNQLSTVFTWIKTLKYREISSKRQKTNIFIITNTRTRFLFLISNTWHISFLNYVFRFFTYMIPRSGRNPQNNFNFS
jgi:hypothetical protein